MRRPGVVSSGLVVRVGWTLPSPARHGGCKKDRNRPAACPLPGQTGRGIKKDRGGNDQSPHVYRPPIMRELGGKRRRTSVGGAFAGGRDQALDFIFGEAGQEPGLARDR